MSSITENERTRRGGKFVAASVAVQLLLSVFLAVPSAQAWDYMPWRWKEPAKITYFVETSGANTVPSWLRSYVVPAVGAWNQTPTPIVIHSTSRGAQQIYVFGYSQADGTGGYGTCLSYDADGYCKPGKGWIGLNYGCHYSNNGTYMCGEESTSPNYDKFVVMHEFGHALGLAHSGVAGAVMNPGACPRETRCPSKPTNDDVDGMNGRYGYRPYGPGNGCGSIALVKSRVSAASGRQTAAGPSGVSSGIVATKSDVLLAGLTRADATIAKTQAIPHPC
jgi:hypothetical protein